MLSRTGSSQPSRFILHWGQRCTKQWLPLLAAPSSPTITQPPASSRRPYATKKKVMRRSPTVIRAERTAERNRTPALSSTPKDSTDAHLFTPQSVPPLEYFIRAVNIVTTGALSAEEARELVLLYCSAITKYKDSWKVILQEHNTSLPTLHNAACLVLAAPNTPEHWKLGTHMLHVASESGHMPSTLSIVSFQHQVLGPNRDRAGGGGGGSETAWLLRAAQQRFEAYLHHPSGQGQRDPDALTLAGFAALRAGDEDRAARYFRRAVEKGNANDDSSPTDADAPPRREPGDDRPARAPRWSWEAATLNQLADYHFRREQDVQAASYWRAAALELDDAAACMGMARVLLRAPADGSGKRAEWPWYLTKAAMSGLVEAAYVMGAWEMQMAQHLRANTGRRGGEQAALEHERLGREWLAIVGEDKSRAKLLARYDPIFSSGIKLSVGGGDGGKN